MCARLRIDGRERSPFEAASPNQRQHCAPQSLPVCACIRPKLSFCSVPACVLAFWLLGAGQATVATTRVAAVSAIARGPAMEAFGAAGARFDSTHRKRRRMMNKHKLRKLRKHMRNIGGENQKKK